MSFVKKILSYKLIRYSLSSGVATGMDVMVYFLAFNFLLRKQDLNFMDLQVISAPTIALGISYSCGLVTNFTITKYFVFTESDLRGRHQLMRYIMVAVLILLLNYGMMSLLIKNLAWYPTIARAFSAVTIGFASFMIHRSYSFRVKKKEAKSVKQFP